MDANDPTVAAIEGATFAPALGRIQVGNDDSFSSAVERIFIAVNGPSENACENPQRQGLFAALTDGFRPNNTFGGIPTLATDYSPLWDANLYEWTPADGVTIRLKSLPYKLLKTMSLKKMKEVEQQSLTKN